MDHEDFGSASLEEVTKQLWRGVTSQEPPMSADHEHYRQFSEGVRLLMHEAEVHALKHIEPTRRVED